MFCIFMLRYNNITIRQIKDKKLSSIGVNAQELYLLVFRENFKTYSKIQIVFFLHPPLVSLPEQPGYQIGRVINCLEDPWSENFKHI